MTKESYDEKKRKYQIFRSNIIRVAATYGNLKGDAYVLDISDLKLKAIPKGASSYRIETIRMYNRMYNAYPDNHIEDTATYVLFVGQTDSHYFGVTDMINLEDLHNEIIDKYPI